MNRNLLLTVSSLLTLLLLTFHLAADVAYGFEPGDTKMVIGALIAVTYLSGILLVPRGLLGYIILLVFAVLATGVPIIHMSGSGLVGPRVAGSSGVFLWVWSNFFLDVTEIFSAIVAMLEIWGLVRSRFRASHKAGL